MAIYHFSVKNISRSDGRSAVACAAYRSGEKLIDHRSGKVQDYTKKFGVEFNHIYAPENTNKNLRQRKELWNTVEKVENRKNSQLAREFEIAFPNELNKEQRQNMLNELCKKIIERHQVIVDACIHAPHTENGSDERNYHAHIMFTTRSINEQGELGKKTREFNDNGKQEVEFWREEFANIANKHLEQNGFDVRLDHRSNKDRGIELEATQHEGPDATELRRKHQKDASITLPDICRKNDEIRKRNKSLEATNYEILITDTLLNKIKMAHRRYIELQHTLYEFHEQTNILADQLIDTDDYEKQNFVYQKLEKIIKKMKLENAIEEANDAITTLKLNAIEQPKKLKIKKSFFSKSEYFDLQQLIEYFKNDQNMLVEHKQKLADQAKKKQKLQQEQLRYEAKQKQQELEIKEQEKILFNQYFIENNYELNEKKEIKMKINSCLFKYISNMIILQAIAYSQNDKQLFDYHTKDKYKEISRRIEYIHKAEYTDLSKTIKELSEIEKLLEKDKRILSEFNSELCDTLIKTIESVNNEKQLIINKQNYYKFNRTIKENTHENRASNNKDNDNPTNTPF